jgi:hypothetical protein
LKIEAAGIPSPSSSMPWGKSGIFSLIFFYSQTLAGLAAYPLTHWSTFCCNSRTTHSFLGGGGAFFTQCPTPNWKCSHLLFFLRGSMSIQVSVDLHPCSIEIWAGLLSSFKGCHWHP